MEPINKTRIFVICSGFIYTVYMALMLDFRERSQLRRAMYAKPTILLFALLVVLTLRGAWGMYEKNQEANIKRDKAIAELSALKERERELKDDILRLSTLRGQEEAIRNRFMVAKDGEKVIIVTQPEIETEHSVTVVDTPKPTFMEKLKAASGMSGH